MLSISPAASNQIEAVKSALAWEHGVVVVKSAADMLMNEEGNASRQ